MCLLFDTLPDYYIETYYIKYIIQIIKINDNMILHLFMYYITMEWEVV